MRCAVVIFLLSFVVACTDGTNAAGSLRSQVTVHDFTYSKSVGGARFVTGKLYNPMTEWITSAQIQIGLYDADHVFVTEINVVVYNVEPGGHMPFRKLVIDKRDVRGAKVRSILVP